MRCGGRALLSAWIPAGPIDAMLAAMGRILGRVTQAPPPERFLWSDPAAVDPLARRAGLALQTTSSAELAIRDSSPEAYVVAGQHHPMALSVRLAFPVLAAVTLGHLGLGLINRAAPQFNLSNIGFTVALVAGCGAFYLVAPAAAALVAQEARTAFAGR